MDLREECRGAKKIGISGHIRPDGDCVGSCVGLGQYIRENYSDKTVDIYLKDIPKRKLPYICRSRPKSFPI